MLRVVWCHVYLNLKGQMSISHKCIVSICLSLQAHLFLVFFCFYPETSVLLRQDLNFLNINILLLYYRCCYWYQRWHVFAVNIVSRFIFAQMKAICFLSIDVCVCVCMSERMDEWLLPMYTLPLSACVALSSHTFPSKVSERWESLRSQQVTLQQTQSYKMCH